IKAEPKLKELKLVKQGRLSVSAVGVEEWKTICKMGGVKGLRFYCAACSAGAREASLRRGRYLRRPRAGLRLWQRSRARSPLRHSLARPVPRLSQFLSACRLAARL